MNLVLRIAVCLFAVGCVSTKVEQLDQVLRLPQPADSVVVYLDQPDQPYTVIAVIDASYEGALKNIDDLRRKMIIEAADLGGEALILGAESRESRVIFVPTPIFFDRKELRGQVITFDRQGEVL